MASLADRAKADTVLEFESQQLQRPSEEKEELSEIWESSFCNCPRALCNTLKNLAMLGCIAKCFAL